MCWRIKLFYFCSTADVDLIKWFICCSVYEKNLRCVRVLWLFQWFDLSHLWKYLADVHLKEVLESVFKNNSLTFGNKVAYRRSTSMPPSAVLCLVVFQAPLLCAGILGMLRLPKFPNNSGCTWQSITRSAVLCPCRLFVTIAQAIPLT